MSKRISVFGLGYVGSVTAGCLSMRGNTVIGVDVNPSKVEAFNAGQAPVLEPGLESLLEEGRREGRIRATSDTEQAVLDSDISFICVGTPSLANGKLDLGVVETVCEQIGTALRNKREPHIVVIRSTVLPGTGEKLVIPALEGASWKRAGEGFQVCSNPEFLREGTAVADFLEPPMTVLGSDEPGATAPLRELYDWTAGEIFETSLHCAEMVKYACNGFHALKIAFANEIGTLCKALSVDAEEVTRIFTADTRLNISPAYLKPGFAFGGSCLPKDLRALSYCGKELDIELPLLDSVLPSNERHLDRAVKMVLEQNSRRIALFGLSFKPGTDDLRESPHIQLVKRLLGEGCSVRIWDPNVSMGQLIGSNRDFIEQTIPHIGSLLHTSLEEVMEDAEVVIVGTADVERDAIEALTTSAQTVIDLVHLSRDNRPRTPAYHGICW
jgi:GDP-mannose 6-dehydrogenase